MNRRGFLAGILAAAAAPAIVRADSLMRIVPRETTITLLNDAPLMATYAGIERFSGAWVPVDASIDEIIRLTIQARSAQIAEDVTARNALLRRLA